MFTRRAMVKIRGVEHMIEYPCIADAEEVKGALGLENIVNSVLKQQAICFYREYHTLKGFDVDEALSAFVKFWNPS